MKKILIGVFECLNEKMKGAGEFDVEMSGSTLNLVVVSNEHVVMANCGDSRSIIIGDKGALLLESRDHKPDLSDEK